MLTFILPIIVLPLLRARSMKLALRAQLDIIPFIYPASVGDPASVWGLTACPRDGGTGTAKRLKLKKKISFYWLMEPSLLLKNLSIYSH